MWIGIFGLGLYSIYITSPMIKMKTEKIDLDKEIENITVSELRNFCIKKWEKWTFSNREILREILIKKFKTEGKRYAENELKYILTSIALKIGLTEKDKEILNLNK